MGQSDAHDFLQVKAAFDNLLAGNSRMRTGDAAEKGELGWARNASHQFRSLNVQEKHPGVFGRGISSLSRNRIFTEADTNRGEMRFSKRSRVNLSFKLF